MHKAKEIREINRSGQKQKLEMKSLLQLEECERHEYRTSDNSDIGSTQYRDAT